ncbi:uncharacterized protein LOC128989325 [Macrosteles quadrilineatus]|uniref:uncharacterized protein LOC128989325 n=1 Tax=Macrosteles quadrilineatus TaxID=74068 RepID=UPI0023E29034|nr:uncharacterized protein LOC128989325 [Macrosteles quadrilineatus]
MDGKISDEMLMKDASDADLDNELDTQEEYKKKWYLMKAKYEMFLKTPTNNDIGQDAAEEIELLLGADILGQLLTGKIEQLDHTLVAVQTVLGWTVMGQCGKSYQSLISISCFAKMDISDLWRLDVLGITDPSGSKTKEANASDVLKHFNKTIVVNSENRYEVTLPWIEGHPELMDNKVTAEKRLHAVTKKLIKLEKFNEYDQVFSEWLNSNIIERVVESSVTDRPVHYLPHHAVVKESSLTTKVRPVFDASAVDSRGNSLNSCLEKGPNLIELIPALLMKFRKHPIGVISDIKKAFLQVSLTESDRDALRFLWWKDYDSREISEFRHCRVVFGVSSSPFLLSATLAHHLENSPETMKDTANKLKESFYVDNCVTSVESEYELHRFVEESQLLLSKAKFELHSWASNVLLPEEIYKSEEKNMYLSDNSVPVLGLMWDVKSDELYCNVNSVSIFDKPITKRSLLSISHRIFDPIGFTCPFTLIPKMLLQQVWKLKLSWDDELPYDILQQFDKWIKDLHYLSSCRIP